MTSVNTNIAGLTAQYNLQNVNRDMEVTMQRLSTGKQINSAGDDAAGLAIVSRMRTQINGLNQSIRNANDGISLIKTSEGAVNEVSNMLQRMRELAVQAASGTNSDADQATLDLEVQQLKVEIDRIATSTQFNSMNLLDGTFSRTLQIGDKQGHSLDVSLDSVKIADLGMGSSSTGGSAIIGQRVTVASDMLLTTAIGEGDIKINGQDVGAIAADASMKDILKAINDKETYYCIQAERALLEAIGGDCDTAIAGFAKLSNNKISLVSELFSNDGKKKFESQSSGHFSKAQEIGYKVGQELLKKAGPDFTTQEN